MKADKRAGILAHLAAAVAIVVAAAPFLWMILTSLKTPPEIIGTETGILPHSLYLQNYKNLFDTEFIAYFVNSGLIAIATTAIALTVAILAGYGFARFRFVGNRPLLLVVVCAQMFPAVLLAIPLYKIMRTLGLLDSRPGLVLVYVTFALPFCIWMMRNYFLGMSVEIEEAALIDGCNRFTALWRVVLPPALPGVAAASAFCIILVWDEYLYANTFIDTDSKRTLSVGLATLMGQYTTDWGRLMAAAVLMTIPIVVIFAFLQRFLTHIAGGGVKG
jgi:ABC-type glycerol-3-phosphate transport system permease component